MLIDVERAPAEVGLPQHILHRFLPLQPLGDVFQFLLRHIGLATHQQVGKRETIAHLIY